MAWIVKLDMAFEREGFDSKIIASEDVVVERSERLDAETLLVVVLTYVGGKLLDHVVRESIKSVIEHLSAFATSRQKQLRIEIEDRDIDPRVQLVAAKVESMNGAEFKEALRLLPTIRVELNSILSRADEPVKDIWYVWQDGAWCFSYYLTEGGEVVDKV